MNNIRVISALLCHRDVPMALKCLGSLVKMNKSKSDIFFHIHDDGSLTESDKEELYSHLPILKIIDRETADNTVNYLLSKYPNCLKYRQKHIYALKLFDVPLLSSSEEVVYVDSDVLFIQPFDNLFELPNQEATCIFMQDFYNSYALYPWHLAFKPISLPKRLNSGLFIINKSKFYSLDFLEWLIGQDIAAYYRYPWFEQTAWGALAMQNKNSYFWDSHQVTCVKNSFSINNQTIAAHFTSPVRDLMDNFETNTSSNAKPLKAQTLKMKKLSALGLAKTFTYRYINNKIYTFKNLYRTTLQNP
jgi:lipopolysaccharide biosynthesis glycosyltransferase